MCNSEFWSPSFVSYSQGNRIWDPRPAKHYSHQLHHEAAHGAGKGVPFQQVPHQGSESRSGRHPRTEWNAGQNLVSESQNETEETRKRRNSPGHEPRLRLRSWPEPKQLQHLIPSWITQLGYCDSQLITARAEYGCYDSQCVVWLHSKTNLLLHVPVFYFWGHLSNLLFFYGPNVNHLASL